MNSMVTVPRNASRPKRVGSPSRPGEPPPRGPSPPSGPSPPAPGGRGPETSGARLSRTSVTMLLRGLLPDGSGVRLHHVVGVHPGHAVVVRPAVDLGDLARPVPVPRRGRRRPLQ